jgi:hypothetical protein
VLGCGLDSTGSAKDLVVVSFQYDNEFSDSIKERHF